VAKNVVIIHNSLPPDAPPDEKDVLNQVQAISDALRNLGYRTATVPLGLDIGAFSARLEELDPLCVFNLVEALDGDGRLIHLACSILDHLRIPYTGAGTEAMFLTSNKVLAKEWMNLSGIPTPEWIVPGKRRTHDLPFPSCYILKTLWEEASVGIDRESVQEAHSIGELSDLLEKRSRMLGKACFAERFIDGREFNLSVLGERGGPRLLPPAEIVFSFPDDRPRIVDYKAKWEEDSVEYRSTVRTFEFGEGDADLLAELERIARLCWNAFDLKGYARVDFRVDGQGRPWVLEINANPCISPDSGFVAASFTAGLSYGGLIERILSDTLERESA
jgi:D-alanine-D-alanine ligase